MPIATLGVDGAGTTQWTKIGGLSIPATMNSDDGDTSYYNNDGETGLDDVQAFTFENMPSDAEIITTHIGYFKAARRSGAEKVVRPAAYFPSSGYGAGSDKTLTSVGTYVLFSRTDMNSGSPSIADMNSGQLLLQHISGSTGDVGWTYVYWDVTYIPFSGGFALFVSQWLPPLLAVASHALSRLEVATILRSLNCRPSSDQDFDILAQAFRRRPRFV